ncbi:MAG: hypothetical protein H0W36_13805 [Gemmatimonadetes bacterium]|nr:hypothetical protein [Gemmatimonadota bacterium]
MPPTVSEQKKAPWAGAHGMRDNPKVLQHMEAVVDGSDYRCLRDIRFRRQPRDNLPFRLYGLVRWLERNHAERLSPADVRELERAVGRLGTDRARPRERGWKQLVPPVALPAVLTMRDRLLRYPTLRKVRDMLRG